MLFITHLAWPQLPIMYLCPRESVTFLAKFMRTAREALKLNFDHVSFPNSWKKKSWFYMAIFYLQNPNIYYFKTQKGSDIVSIVICFSPFLKKATRKQLFESLATFDVSKGKCKWPFSHFFCKYKKKCTFVHVTPLHTLYYSSLSSNAMV